VALLVGTVIQSARVALPDLPATIPAPVPNITVIPFSGSTLVTGATYFVGVTYRNPWGETIFFEAGPYEGFPAASALQIDAPLVPGATYLRVYLTPPNGPVGSESQFIESTTSPIVVSGPLPNAGALPQRNTAYNPDTDGFALSTGQMYTWLNEALTRLSRVVGGVLDYSGVGTTAGQPYYVVTGEWLAVPNVWYNGWWVQGADPGGFFKRNAVLTSILSRVAVSIFDDRCIFEVSYQPDRTAGATTTTAAMGPTDTFVTVADPGQFYLANGFAQIGTEIVAYSKTNISPLSGLIRRLGGTSAQSWPSGTPVYELNLFFQGRRILDLNLQPGMSLFSLPIPAGWTSLLTDYIIAKYRSAEQDYQEQQARLAEFDAACRDWAFNKTVQRHVQVGGTRTPLTFGRTIAGGLIIP
jgi:hypothetical protein